MCTSFSTDTSGIHLQTQKCMQTPAESGQEYLTSGKEYMLLLLLLSRFSCVRLCVTPWTAAYQAPAFMGFSRQEYLPCTELHKKSKDFREGLHYSLTAIP